MPPQKFLGIQLTWTMESTEAFEKCRAQKCNKRFSETTKEVLL